MSKIEKVLVIQTCIDLSWSEMKWLLNALPINAGDEIIFLALLQHTNTSTSSFLSLSGSASKILGYKGKEDSCKKLGSDRKKLDEERKKRKEEYKQNSGILKLQEKLQSEKKVKVNVELAVCLSRKVAAIRAAKKLGATAIILDREMKKEKQYYMDRLSCGIWSMKSNNTIVEIRGPINEHVSYDEMNPSYSISPSGEEDISPSTITTETPAKASCKQAPSSSSTSHLPSTSTSTSTCTALEAKRSTGDNINVNTKKPISSHDSNKSNSGRALKLAKNDKKDDHVLVSLNLNQLFKLEGSNGIYRHNKFKEFDNPVCSVCKNRRPKIARHRDFSYAELDEATDAFSRKNFISEGGFGFVFKGKLRDGLRVAVKQLKAASLQGEKEFKSEVYVLSQARHQNLVMLLGSCTQGTHRLLVYEYICNGSLEDNLSSECSHPLNWEQRMKIARGAAKGLAYLHERNIVHRDMRPGNILITHDFETLLGDFGLAKAQQDDAANSTGVVGTLGYVAPEYAECGKMSDKTDVYSFGVVLLQLITGLRTTDEIPGGKSLVGWAKPLLEAKNYPDLIDRRISEDHDVHQLFWMVLAAESCLKEDPDERLTMKQVVQYLNCNKEGNNNFNIDYT